MDEDEALKRVRVSFRKELSDGNYGTEAAEVTFEDEVEPEADEAKRAARLLAMARYCVHEELLRSPSSAVRRAVEPPAAQPALARVATEPDLDDLPF
jgi:hypothetical protein